MRSYENFWGQMGEVTLWSENGRQVVKDDLMLSGLKKPWRKDTSAVLCSFYLVRCSLADRTFCASTPGLVQESGPSQQQQEFVGGNCKCESSQQMSTWGVHWGSHNLRSPCLSKFTKELFLKKKNESSSQKIRLHPYPYLCSPRCKGETIIEL